MSIWYGIREGIAGFRRAKAASAITIFTVTFALLLVGLCGIVAANLSQLVSGLRARVEIEVFLASDLTDQEVQKLEESIRALDGVEAVEFVSKERAALEFRQTFGEDVLAILDQNPFPASFRVRPAARLRTSEGAERIAEGIRRMPGVDEVLYRGDLLRLLDRYARLALGLGLTVGGVLVIGAILLVHNTLRLVMMARAEVIEIMRLVGATRRFIRRPFVVHGVFEGLLGGVLGALCLALLVRLARIEIPNLVEVDPRWYYATALGGALLGWMGSRLAVRRYLR